MNLAMAVGTAPVKIAALGWQIPISMRTNVTLVAEPRHPYFEQPVVDGTVRLMAVGAIFKDRWMLMKVGPPSLGMTGVAVLVHARLFELGRVGCAVRVVTIRTGNLPFP